MPEYLKFLKALQADTGNNFSYLVSMNIVRIYCGRGRQFTSGVYSGVKCPPPSTLMYPFILML